MRRAIRWIVALVAAFVLAAALVLVLSAPPAAADGCASRAEYDNLSWGLSTTQVANRFETNGSYIGISATGLFFKRAYDPCWTDTKKIVIWYDLDIGLTDHWDIRDS